MQWGKNTQYAMAGVQAAPGMRMNVRSNVRLPDSEVGCGGEAEQREPYYAGEVRRDPARRTVTIPANIGLIFLCALVLVFGVMIVCRACERARIAKSISAMEQSISATRQNIAQKEKEVAEARDPGRVSYAATHDLNMIDASSVIPVLVEAPDTRPEIRTTVTAGAESSPYSARDGIITGSR